MAQLQEYKCPACGGALEFNAGIQKVKCPYCDTEYEMETLEKLDEQLKQEAEQKDDLKWDKKPGSEWQENEKENMVMYSCESCGGQIVCDRETAATTCPYCDNPVVMVGNFKGNLRPDYVIPFQLDKKAAKEKFWSYLKDKRLLPKVFKTETHIDEIKGVYVPFWLFDADVNAHMRYKATRVETWSDSDYNYTKTSYYSIIRGGTVGFERVPVDGSSKMPDDLMESLEPFDFSQAVDFQTAYLAGYLADKYDVSEEQSENRANARIRNSTESVFRSTVNGYATVTQESSSIRFSNGNASYALFPVWLLNTTWRGTRYTFAMNGQTGKFVGNLPTDWGAYWRWLLSIAGGVGVAIYAVMWLWALL